MVTREAEMTIPDSALLGLFVLGVFTVFILPYEEVEKCVDVFHKYTKFGYQTRKEPTPRWLFEIFRPICSPAVIDG